MKRLYILFAIFWLASHYDIALVAANTTLNFNVPVPGTLLDKDGIGTGFTSRMPGSGSAIPAIDPNLSLDTANGYLLVGSTRSDFSTTGLGRNLSSMEAPALLLSGIGNGNFDVYAHFLNLRVDQASDQIGVFVGASVDNVVRGGVHEDIPDGGYQTFFVNSQNGADTTPGNTVLDNFQPGQDAVFDFGRTPGVWHFRWQNLSNPSNSGSFENILLPGLDAQSDLYVGIFNNDARNFTPQTATLDSFSVTPEPSSFVLISIGAAVLCRAIRRCPRKRSWRFTRPVHDAPPVIRSPDIDSGERK